MRKFALPRCKEGHDPRCREISQGNISDEAEGYQAHQSIPDEESPEGSREQEYDQDTCLCTRSTCPSRPLHSSPLQMNPCHKSKQMM